MTLSSDRSAVARLQKEINELQRKQAEEMKKVAQATRNMNSALASASRASSPSSARPYFSTADREAKNVENAQDKAARYGTDISRKMGDLTHAQERVFSGEEKQRKDQAAIHERQRKADEDARKKLRSDNLALAKDLASLKAQLTAAIERQAEATQPFVVENAEGQATPYDFFISHATADKEDFVDGLVSRAQAAGLNVWYDTSALV